MGGWVELGNSLFMRINLEMRRDKICEERAVQAQWKNNVMNKSWISFVQISRLVDKVRGKVITRSFHQFKPPCPLSDGGGGPGRGCRGKYSHKNIYLSMFEQLSCLKFIILFRRGPRS